MVGTYDVCHTDTKRPHLGMCAVCSPPGSSVRGILQARILEWVALPSSRGLPNPGIKPASLMSLALAGGLFTTNNTWEAQILSNEVFTLTYSRLLR